MFSACLCWAESDLSISLYGKKQKLYLSGSYGLAFIVNQKMNNSTCKLQKGDDRIPVPQLARFKSKRPNENVTKIWVKKDGFKSRIRGFMIRLKIVETLSLG